jgi:hypothetical protein
MVYRVCAKGLCCRNYGIDIVNTTENQNNISGLGNISNFSSNADIVDRLCGLVVRVSG